KYHGTEVKTAPNACYGWSRIPHFYRPFYVYQYATGFAASIALSKKIREEGAPAIERYLNLLKSGSKDYSINLLKEAGMDMTTPAPILDALHIFDGLLDNLS
ncbi:MAG: M3 family metallopeptidase, partial [Defluviitaleaceae bacterium]|nr:M3 family metallopeptidase [Defluviitaleaceae bacterium]